MYSTFITCEVQVNFPTLVICKLRYSALIICELRYSAMIICELRYSALIICELRYSALIIWELRYSTLIICELRYSALIICELRYSTLIMCELRYCSRDCIALAARPGSASSHAFFMARISSALSVSFFTSISSYNIQTNNGQLNIPTLAQTITRTITTVEPHFKTNCKKTTHWLTESYTPLL